MMHDAHSAATPTTLCTRKRTWRKYLFFDIFSSVISVRQTTFQFSLKFIKTFSPPKYLAYLDQGTRGLVDVGIRVGGEGSAEECRPQVDCYAWKPAQYRRIYTIVRVINRARTNRREEFTTKQGECPLSLITDRALSWLKAQIKQRSFITNVWL